MKEQLKAKGRLIILTGVMVGLAAIMYILGPIAPPSNSSRADNIEPKTSQTEPEPEPAPKPYEFPAGGRALLPNYRLVALYGNFAAKSLGSLGEQPPEQAIARVKDLAKQYQMYSEEPVYPAFEIITTVASAGAGQDGNYSNETSVDKLRPVIELAKSSGVYIVLDLQPGRSDFLSQAKIYEEFLSQPHVGLALDPEWRLLKPEQKHLVKIGSVSAAEINATADWLTDLVKANDLPQKLLLIHQFKLSMISNRETLNTSGPELAWSIQMDGLGAQNVKQNTWRNIRANAPKNIYFGWKNFIDEDKPMLSPEQTMQISPKPVFVSYQ